MVNFTQNYINYSSTSGSTVSVTGVSSPPTNWNAVIPNSVTDSSSVYTVVSIGNSAFTGCSTLNFVDLSGATSLTTFVNNNAFSNCTSLTSIYMSPSILNFGTLCQVASLITFTIATDASLKIQDV